MIRERACGPRLTERLLSFIVAYQRYTDTRIHVLAQGAIHRFLFPDTEVVGARATPLRHGSVTPSFNRPTVQREYRTYVHSHVFLHNAQSRFSFDRRNMDASILIFPLCGLILYILWRVFQSGSSTASSTGTLQTQHIQDEKKRDQYLDIQPLHDFDWQTTSPIRNASLKPKFHLTMGNTLRLRPHRNRPLTAIQHWRTSLYPT
jgi:hypothetical protein